MKYMILKANIKTLFLPGDFEILNEIISNTLDY